jgi:hypothetical protein
MKTVSVQMVQDASPGPGSAIEAVVPLG